MSHSHSHREAPHSPGPPSGLTRCQTGPLFWGIKNGNVSFFLSTSAQSPNLLGRDGTKQTLLQLWQWHGQQVKCPPAYLCLPWPSLKRSTQLFHSHQQQEFNVPCCVSRLPAGPRSTICLLRSLSEFQHKGRLLLARRPPSHSFFQFPCCTLAEGRW